MTMDKSRSHFRRRLRFRPLAYTAAAPEPVEPALRRPAPLLRPSRYAVGLATFGKQFLREDELHSAPLDPADYVGRVEEVSEEGEVIARLWEYPAGMESMAVLTPAQMAGQRTHPGASLRVWTWMELPDGAHGEPEPRVHVEVRNKELTTEERRELGRLADELRAAEEKPGPPEEES